MLATHLGKMSLPVDTLPDTWCCGLLKALGLMVLDVYWGGQGDEYP